MQEMITVSQAARVMGCSHSLIYSKLEKDKDFPEPQIVAGLKLFDKDAIESYAKNKPIQKYKRPKK